MAIICELIDWQALRERYIDLAVPIEQVLMVSPHLLLVYDPDAGRLGMRLQLDPGRKWARVGALQNVTTRLVLLSGLHYVEVSTDSAVLFRPIYLLMSDVLSRMLEGEKDCLRALDLSLSDFESLVAKSGQMSKEKAVGLFGELWVLHILLSRGIADIACWIGANRESHDFRLGSVELEIKTTTSNVRKHSIHGLNQLSPTPGHELHLVSIRLGSAGSSIGRSVAGLVADIKSVLGTDNHALRRFNQHLFTYGYNGEQEESLIAYQLAAPPLAIAVGKEFPAVSYEWLSTTLGEAPASRIRDVELVLDVEGLGQPLDVTQYKK